MKQTITQKKALMFRFIMRAWKWAWHYQEGITPTCRRTFSVNTLVTLLLPPHHFLCTWRLTSKWSPQVSLTFDTRLLDWVGFIIEKKDAFLERILTHCKTLQVGAIFVDNMQIFSPPTFFFLFYLWPLPVSYCKYVHICISKYVDHSREKKVSGFYFMIFLQLVDTQCFI